MKVVLFCGGLGTRLRAHSEKVPKSMVEIGRRPIMWHIMKYYAHFGHTEFVLCLGYMGDVIKRYFLNYDESVSNDFVLHGGGGDVELLNNDTKNWTISFVDTGIRTNIGGRLRAVRELIEDDEMFLATYSDALTDADLNSHVNAFRATDKTASMLAVRPAHSFHTISLGEPSGGGSEITGVHASRDADVWINGGFFAFRREIFDVIEPGEELVEEPLERLVDQRRAMAYRHEGWWAPMDTYKDKKRFDEMHESGDCPWEVWNRS